MKSLPKDIKNMKAEDFVDRASADTGFERKFNLEFKVPKESAGGLEVMS